MFDAQKYKNEYNKTKYYETKVRFPKEKREVLEALVEKTGKSINRLAIEAMEKTYKIDLTIVESKLKQSK